MVSGSNSTALSNVFCHSIRSVTSPNRTTTNAMPLSEARFSSTVPIHSQGETSTRHANRVVHATHNMD